MVPLPTRQQYLLQQNPSRPPGGYLLREDSAAKSIDLYRGQSGPPPLDLNADNISKLRALELNILDFKGAVDRRFNEVVTELPGRLQRDLQAAEAREQQLAKDMGAKLAQVHSGWITGRDNLRG